MDKDSTPVTSRINAEALKILEQNPEGVRWVDLIEKIQESDPSYHPKTINGCIWRLVERFPQAGIQAI